MNYEPVILVLGIIFAFILLPKAYWRFKIWRLCRVDDFVSEAEFLRTNKLRRDAILTAIEGGDRLRIRRVNGANYIHRDSAKAILESISAIKQMEALEGVYKSGLASAAGAAIGSMVAASKYKQPADNMIGQGSIVLPPGTNHSGVVRWYYAKKGFGFIQPDGNYKDVFFHADNFKRSDLSLISEGQKVSFAIVIHGDKVVTENIRLSRLPRSDPN